MHERINESSPSFIWRLFLWCETAVFLLPVVLQFSFCLYIFLLLALFKRFSLLPTREKRLKKASKGCCHSITQLFSLHQNNPESSTSEVPPVNEPTPENQQNEPETPQSESNIPIDGDNAPTQAFETKRQSDETDVIQPKFHPPKTYVFLKTKIGSSERSSHAHWCEDYPWLHYSAEKDAAFCYVGIISDKKKKHNRFSSYKESTFIETGFRNWKKCPKAFIDYATFQYHRDNVLLLTEEEITGDVSELISTEHKRQKQTIDRCFYKSFRTFSF